jgi:hypothetical protein
MKLENQVCSLELAKRLKELGVKQESLFYWCQMEKPTRTAWDIRGEKFIDDYKYTSRELKYISAFTVAELGEMLPKLSCSGKYTKDYICNLVSGELQTAKTEANARAKMVIYLKEKDKKC